MTAICDQLIESLRNELLENGELLGLLNKKESAILAGKPNSVLAMQKVITLQLKTIGRCRSRRQETVRDIAISVGKTCRSPLRELISSCPRMIQPLLKALAEEVVVS